MARRIPTPEEEGGMERFLSDAAGISEDEAVEAASLVMMDRHIADDRVLRGKTGMTPENFRLLRDALHNHMQKDPKSALFWGKDGCEESAGRRCAVAPRHMLLIYLECARHGASQEYVAADRGISQTSVSRYCAYVEPVLAKLLPTGDNMAERIRRARTMDQVQRAAADALACLEEAAGAEPGSAGSPGPTVPGNTLLHDGVHIPEQRAKDPERRDAEYSGKKKRYTKNIVATTNREGLVLGMSEAAPGSTHDLTLYRASGADLGLLTRCMEGKSSAAEVEEKVDKGFRGLDKDHPGSRVAMPLPRARSKTKKAKKHNSGVNRTRVPVENTFGDCKCYKPLSWAARRLKSGVRALFNVVTGLVNLHLLTGSPDPARTHRKGKKPGPKTARSR